MKNKILLLIAFSLLLCFSVKSQDILYYHNGDSVIVTILKTTPETVEFKYPEEEVTNVEYKNSLIKIKYKSGRIELCKPKSGIIEIKGIEDWEKVILTNNPDDVKGLTKIGEVAGRSGVGGLAAKSGYTIARKKIKKEAAKLKASIVLIQKDNHGYSGTIIIGDAYK